MESKIELQLLAVDFKDTDFTECDCAIEKAVKRQLGVKECGECVDWVYIDNQPYAHEYYGIITFKQDKAIAEGKSDNTLIRTITLTKE